MQTRSFLRRDEGSCAVLWGSLFILATLPSSPPSLLHHPQHREGGTPSSRSSELMRLLAPSASV